MDQEAAARELYALEGSRPFDTEQLQRWRSLATVVFPRAGREEQRASQRIRGQCYVRVSGPAGASTFEVKDAGFEGLAIKGPTQELTPGAVVRIVAIRSGLSGEWEPVEFACNVMTIRSTDQAVLTLADRDGARRHDYFVHAYYPLYLTHLRSLAGL